MSQRYQYRIDATDKIVWVDTLWLAFANENGAAELTQESVLGRPLWDFIAGDGTRRLFAELHSRVRTSLNSVLLPFRCDSPSLKRHMRLHISAGDEGELFYESTLVRVEPQRYVAALDPEQTRSSCVLTMCSCCKRALLETVGWLELEDIAARLHLFDSPEVPDLRYSVCPDCGQTVRNAFDNGNASQFGECLE